METQMKWLLGGLAAVVVGYIVFKPKTAQAAAAPRVPALPAVAAWPDYQTIPASIMPGTVKGINVETKVLRVLSPSESFTYSDLENKGLAVAGIPGYVFYANEGGKVARYWTPNPLST